MSYAESAPLDGRPSSAMSSRELRRRLDSGRRLADEYRMAEPQAVQLCSEAMLAHVEGRFDDARRHYAEATGQMRRNGSLHADGFHRLARLTIELSQAGGGGGGRAARPAACTRRQPRCPCGPISSTPSSPRSGPWRPSPWATAPRPGHSSPT